LVKVNVFVIKAPQPGKRKTLMKIKVLAFCALIFLLLGWNTKDGVLFFFFAIHVLTLAIAVVASRFDRKRTQVLKIEPLPEPDSSES
jgi:hypothetical protein